jgi:hypothetical protein
LGGPPPYNSCGIEKGQPSEYKIRVEPAGVPDANIKWSKVSGNISFAGGNSGRTVTIKGDDLGVAKAKVDIIGFTGTTPTIEMEILEKKTVNAYVYIIRKDDGTSPARTEAEVASLIVDVNKYYSQVAMEIVVQGGVRYINKTDWLTIQSAGNYAEQDVMQSTTNNTGGIEIYFVDDIEGSATGVNYSPSNAAAGLMVEDGGNARTVAHEIGHAAGLEDIYDQKGGTTLSNDPVKEVWEPKDWNSGSGPAYYEATLKQPGLVQRLLMYGYTSTTKADIPRGQVHGLNTSEVAGLRNVGLQSINRTPTHW